MKLPDFLRALLGFLGIPVSYSLLFPGSWKWCDHRGIVLDGDPGMPPTELWFLPGFLNKAWNGILALFVWQTYTILEVGTYGPYHVAFRSDSTRPYDPKIAGKWAVMPQRIDTPYVAVKNGNESCEFAIFHEDGRPQGFGIVVRGSKSEVKEALQVGMKIRSKLDELSIEDRPDYDLRLYLTFV